MKYKTYIQSLLTQERKAFTDEVIERFPFIEIFKSVNGFDPDEVIKEFLSLNEEILKVDLINKGLMRAETWEQIERVILKLQDATSLQN